MRADDGNDRIWKIDRRENVGAHVDVELHLLELEARQLARLVQDVLRDRKFARVVQQRRGVDRLDRVLVGHAKRLGQTDRKFLHAPNVIRGDAVFGLNRGRQRLDGDRYSLSTVWTYRSASLSRPVIDRSVRCSTTTSGATASAAIAPADRMTMTKQKAADAAAM
jgi:hypothetical protein